MDRRRRKRKRSYTNDMETSQHQLNNGSNIEEDVGEKEDDMPCTKPLTCTEVKDKNRRRKFECVLRNLVQFQQMTFSNYHNKEPSCIFFLGCYDEMIDIPTNRPDQPTNFRQNGPKYTFLMPKNSSHKKIFSGMDNILEELNPGSEKDNCDMKNNDPKDTTATTHNILLDTERKELRFKCPDDLMSFVETMKVGTVHVVAGKCNADLTVGKVELSNITKRSEITEGTNWKIAEDIFDFFQRVYGKKRRLTVRHTDFNLGRGYS